MSRDVELIKYVGGMRTIEFRNFEENVAHGTIPCHFKKRHIYILSLLSGMNTIYFI